MDYTITITNRKATCRRCRQKIYGNEPRLRYRTTYKDHGTYWLYCYDCAKKKIKEERQELTVLHSKLSRAIKKASKAIVMNRLTK
jgi:late competence protein required for DNA uptake (superfamily II DNA/RNA helicase)